MSFLSLSLFVLCKSVMVLFADQHAGHQHSQPVSHAMARYYLIRCFFIATDSTTVTENKNIGW